MIIILSLLILLMIAAIFLDWSIAIIWVAIELIYYKKKRITDYKPDVKARRELIKNNMIDKIK